MLVYPCSDAPFTGVLKSQDICKNSRHGVYFRTFQDNCKVFRTTFQKFQVNNPLPRPVWIHGSWLTFIEMYQRHWFRTICCNKWM